MEQDIKNQIAVSRKGMGDFTRLILAFYACLLMLGVYQQISLYSSGILDSVVSSNLIILAAHHLGFTALLSLFLYFTFNALETIKPRMGLYVTGAILTAVLLFEGGLTAYFVTQFEMPAASVKSFFAILDSSPKFIVPVLIAFAASGFAFYALYKWSAPMQHWMGRVYPFTLAVFSLFLATLLARSAPLSENKTKYFLVEWYKKVTRLQNQEKQYAANHLSIDPLEKIYRQEADYIWNGSKNGIPALAGPQSNVVQSGSYTVDPFSDYRLRYRQYPKADKKELLRIQSAFRGRNFDRAFETARQLAYTGQSDRAIELCQYILAEVPEYVDAEILLGRILSWEGEFQKSAGVLEQVIQKYPNYQDGYAALLDTYYWGGDIKRSLALKPFIERHFRANKTLKEKLHRVELKSKKTLLQTEPSEASEG